MGINSFPQPRQDDEAITSLAETGDFKRDAEELKRILTKIRDQNQTKPSSIPEPPKVAEQPKPIEAQATPSQQKYTQLPQVKQLNSAKLRDSLPQLSFEITGAPPPGKTGEESRLPIEEALEAAESPAYRARQRSLISMIKGTREDEKPIYTLVHHGLDAIVLNKDEKLNCTSRLVRASEFIGMGRIAIPEGKTASEAKKEAYTKLHETLGLAELAFKVYRNNDFETIDLPTAVKTKKMEEEGKKPNVYLLIHGWTGTHEIFEIEMIQEILKRDPNAIIIAPDGNGFGESKFNPKTKISDKCTIPKYADQMTFIMKDLLGLSDEQMENIRMFGHSMGGGTVMELASRGVGMGKDGTAVAVAPAMMAKLVKGDVELQGKEPPTPDQIASYKFQPKEEYPDPHERRIPIIYRGLDWAMKTTAGLSKIPGMKGITKAIVSQTFKQVLGPVLMGRSKNGTVDSEKFAKYMEVLDGIHNIQLQEKQELAAGAMEVLANSVDIENYSEAQLKNMGKVKYFEGAEDMLGTGAPHNKIMRFIEKVKVPFRKIIKNAGHYAPVFEEEAKQALLHHPKYYPN